MILTSGVAGLITGFVGNIFTAWNTRKTKQMEHKFELDRIEAETNALVREAEANIKITESQIAGDIKLSELDIFGKNLVEGNKSVFKETYMERLFQNKFGVFVGIILSFLFGFADFVRSITRPAITLGLVLLTAYMIKNGLGAISDMVDLVVYLATTAVVWWFGYRNEANFQIKKKQ